MPRQKKVKLIGLGLPANLLKEFIDLSYRGNTSIAPEGYDIDAPLSDSRVKVYQKKGSKQVIVTHRGSVGLADWWDNAKFLVAGKVKSTKTFKLHRERQLKAVEKYGGENIIGLGHSRAGLYLQEMQKDPATKLGEIITYNKAVGFYDALRENPEEQTDVKVKNDFVSLLSGLQKRPNKMVEIDVTPNPLDFNKAHQPAELEKLGDTFIGKKEEIEGGAWFADPLPFQAMRYASNKTGLSGSGRAPSPKTLDQLKKMLKTLEKQLININKGKVYKTTNKDKVSYEISYTKARIANHETKGEDLIITKKAKYKDELPAKAKAYKAKAVKPKKEVKIEIVELKPEPKKEEPKKEEPKKEEPKIEVPTPEPTSKKILPLINKLESKIKEFEALGKKHGAVIYNGEGFTQVVAYIALLIEYEAKCAIIGGKDLTNYGINSILDSEQNTNFYSKAEKLSSDLLDCIKRGDKMIAMPLNLNFGTSSTGHANLLIYRPYENTIERFEPYGDLPNASAEKIFNQVLKRMFEVEMKPYLKELTPKFISPDQVCPNIKGFQALEEQLGLLEQEGGGFCAMWSLFILELIFLNPTLSTKEIIEKGLTLAKSKPQYLRNVIRGYVLKTEKMLDSYVKKIGINDGFNFKIPKKLKKSSTLFQEQLLNLLLSFGGENSNIKELEETIPRNKRLDALRDLLSTKTNKEINDMAKIIFKSNFGVHNYKKWNVEDMTTFIIKTYLIPNVPKYKPSYEDEILKYFANPELEGGGFLWTTKEEKEERRAKRKAREAEEKAKKEKDKEDWDNKLIALTERIKKKQKQKGETAPKAVDTAPKAEDTAPKAIESTQQGIEEGQQGIEEGEPMAGAGFNYLDAVAYPINPVYNYRNYGEIPSIIESEDEFLVGGSFTDMAGMNCDKTTGECFNPVWEKQKIKRQILSEYKIWYWPWGAPPAGHIRMAWLEPMIQERYQPLYEEFVKRRNVNIGLPPDASKDRFAQQMFSNLTDGLSYVPIFNTATSLGLSAASSLADTKKEDGS
jgi:hypothetical protein